MLVLSRKSGEVIKIGQDVEVVAVQAGKVRLGVTAPPSVPVDRSEVYDRKRAATERESVQLGALPDDPAAADTSVWLG